jgi:ribosomal protein L16 Arg81 hydroxylase
MTYSDFMAEYSGREYLVVKGQADRFADLFSWGNLETLLSTQRFDVPRLRLVRKGKLVPAATYIRASKDRRGAPYATHVSSAVAREMKNGAMLHLVAVNDAWEPLTSFAAALELELTASVQVNLHAALARSRGFSTHWDGHDVFVMQVAGKKAWRLFGFTEQAPRAVPPDQKGCAPTVLIREFTLDAGDMLYLPRGYWHAAEAIDDLSLHLTCAVQYPTGFDFLMWCVGRLADDVLARRDIPFNALQRAKQASRLSAHQYVAELFALVGHGHPERALGEFLDHYRSGLGHTNKFNIEGVDHA